MITALVRFLGFNPKRDYNVSNKRAWTAAIAIVLTQIMDFTTTTFGLSNGANEGNGIMAEFIHRHGIFAFLALKIFASVFLAWSTFRRKYAPWIIAVMYFLVTLWNCVIIVFLR